MSDLRSAEASSPLSVPPQPHPTPQPPLPPLPTAPQIAPQLPPQLPPQVHPQVHPKLPPPVFPPLLHPPPPSPPLMLTPFTPASPRPPDVADPILAPMTSAERNTSPACPTYPAAQSARAYAKYSLRSCGRGRRIFLATRRAAETGLAGSGWPVAGTGASAATAAALRIATYASRSSDGRAWHACCRSSAPKARVRRWKAEAGSCLTVAEFMAEWAMVCRASHGDEPAKMSCSAARG
jgi:hypothetical protein